MFCLCFAWIFYVCQNPKILFSQNKILDFCLTQVLRKQSVCQTQVKHRANIVSHNSAHLQRRWKHVRDSWDTWLPEWFVDSFVFCWWVVLCFIVDSLAFCLWWVSDVFMIHLCLLLCCVYVVLCWFFTSLVYVRLLASDLVPIDEALWVYLSKTKRFPAPALLKTGPLQMESTWLPVSENCLCCCEIGSTSVKERFMCQFPISERKIELRGQTQMVHMMQSQHVFLWVRHDPPSPRFTATQRQVWNMAGEIYDYFPGDDLEFHIAAEVHFVADPIWEFQAPFRSLKWRYCSISQAIFCRNIPYISVGRIAIEELEFPPHDHDEWV